MYKFYNPQLMKGDECLIFIGEDLKIYFLILVLNLLTHITYRVCSLHSHSFVHSLFGSLPAWRMRKIFSPVLVLFFSFSFRFSRMSSHSERSNNNSIQHQQKNLALFLQSSDIFETKRSLF
jgi:hypothetical protein